MGSFVMEEAVRKRPGTSSRLPWQSLMAGERAARDCAEAEVESRVTPRMVKEGAVGEDRRARITAPPCWPVAPVMRRTFLVDMVGGCDGGEGDLRICGRWVWEMDMMGGATCVRDANCALQSLRFD